MPTIRPGTGRVGAWELFLGGTFLQGRLTGQEGGRQRASSQGGAVRQWGGGAARTWGQAGALLGVLALGSKLRPPWACAACPVETDLLGRHENQQRARLWATASQHAPRLPPLTQQHLQQQPGVRTNWPHADMPTVSSCFVARPRGKRLFPGVCGQSQVEIFSENL